MSIEDVTAFDDYELMDVGEYKPIRSELVTVSRDAWDDMQKYIERLEEENKELEYHVNAAERYCLELEEKLNAVNSQRIL